MSKPDKDCSVHMLAVRISLAINLICTWETIVYHLRNVIYTLVKSMNQIIKLIQINI